MSTPVGMYYDSLVNVTNHLFEVDKLSASGKQKPTTTIILHSLKCEYKQLKTYKLTHELELPGFGYFSCQSSSFSTIKLYCLNR